MMTQKEEKKKISPKTRKSLNHHNTYRDTNFMGIFHNPKAWISKNTRRKKWPYLKMDTK